VGFVFSVGFEGAVVVVGFAASVGLGASVGFVVVVGWVVACVGSAEGLVESDVGSVTGAVVLFGSVGGSVEVNPIISNVSLQPLSNSVPINNIVNRLRFIVSPPLQIYAFIIRNKSKKVKCQSIFLKCYQGGNSWFRSDDSLAGGLWHSQNR
jgi:hypothetical protein